MKASVRGALLAFEVGEAPVQEGQTTWAFGQLFDGGTAVVSFFCAADLPVTATLLEAMSKGQFPTVSLTGYVKAQVSKHDGAFTGKLSYRVVEGEVEHLGEDAPEADTSRTNGRGKRQPAPA